MSWGNSQRRSRRSLGNVRSARDEGGMDLTKEGAVGREGAVQGRVPGKVITSAGRG